MNFLCAANQLGKSSTQIRKAIHWATEKKLWSFLWKKDPSQFWYLYPSGKVATTEFDEKWKEFMPVNKDCPKYGWERKNSRDGFISHIIFKSGVTIYFKFYSQNVQNLQSGTVDAIFADEEMPYEIMGELVVRIAASNGYFHMVFTATIGQEEWRKTIEPKKTEDEMYPTAFKIQVSLYDCLEYEDGSETPWTLEDIERVKASCGTANDILKRVYGKFIMAEGLKYPSFDIKNNVCKPKKIPKDWVIYSGVDPGSGGEKNHPAAIVFIAVNPEYTKGAVFLGWRGDKIETTAGDCLEKYRELRGDLKPIEQRYDWADKDFGIIAIRQGEAFTPAEKSHERGEKTLNTLFKNQMLDIYDEAELQKLVGEFTALREDTPKRKAKDDFIDAARYTAVTIPWDWSTIHIIGMEKKEKEQLTPEQIEVRDRREHFFGKEEEENQVERDFEEWNEFYGA